MQRLSFLIVLSGFLLFENPVEAGFPSFSNPGKKLRQSNAKMKKKMKQQRAKMRQSIAKGSKLPKKPKKVAPAKPPMHSQAQIKAKRAHNQRVFAQKRTKHNQQHQLRVKQYHAAVAQKKSKYKKNQQIKHKQYKQKDAKARKKHQQKVAKAKKRGVIGLPVYMSPPSHNTQPSMPPYYGHPPRKPPLRLPSCPPKRHISRCPRGTHSKEFAYKRGAIWCFSFRCAR